METRLIMLPVFITALSIVPVCFSSDIAPIQGLQQAHHSQVKFHGGFWGTRLDINHTVTVPHALDCLERAGHVTNFDKAAGIYDGPLRGNHAFDSDIHKALEGALYSLAHYGNKSLADRVQNIIDRILAAQQPDGFLISCFIVQDQDQLPEASVRPA